MPLDKLTKLANNNINKFNTFNTIVDFLNKATEVHLNLVYKNPPDLSDWIKNNSYSLLRFIYLVIGVFSLVKIIQSVAPSSTNFNFALTSHIIHLIAIVASIFYMNSTNKSFVYTISEREPIKKESIQISLNIMSNSLEKFKNMWSVLWLLWFFLYILLIGSSISETFNSKIDLSIFINLLNNFASLTIYLMYRELSRKTVNVDDLGNISNTNTFIPIVQGIAICVTFLIIEFFGKEVDKGNYYGEISEILKSCSGLIAGIATGLLAGKLSSTFINVPKPVIVVLFIYSAIQLWYPDISISDGVELSIFKKFAHNFKGTISLSFALIGKVTLMVCLQWCLNTHRIAYSMVKGREQIENGNAMRKAFVYEFLSENERRDIFALENVQLSTATSGNIQQEDNNGAQP